MYVKIFNQILDSSLAENRPLRHFFMDLLLCADMDGNVIMTKKAIAKRIGADLKEVEWGIKELMKPDPESRTTDMKGKRIIDLDGHGYGWTIVNFKEYRDLRSATELRERTAERVRRYRERLKEKAAKKSNPMKKKQTSGPLIGEMEYVRKYEAGYVDKTGLPIKSQPSES